MTYEIIKYKKLSDLIELSLFGYVRLKKTNINKKILIVTSNRDEIHQLEKNVKTLFNNINVEMFDNINCSIYKNMSKSFYINVEISELKNRFIIIDKSDLKKFCINNYDILLSESFNTIDKVDKVMFLLINSIKNIIYDRDTIYNQLNIYTILEYDKIINLYRKYDRERIKKNEIN